MRETKYRTGIFAYKNSASQVHIMVVVKPSIKVGKYLANDRSCDKAYLALTESQSSSN